MDMVKVKVKVRCKVSVEVKIRGSSGCVRSAVRWSIRDYKIFPCVSASDTGLHKTVAWNIWMTHRRSQKDK